MRFCFSLNRVFTIFLYVVLAFLAFAAFNLAHGQIPVGGNGVSSINGSTGAFTFSGSGVSCTTTSCTFSGTGSGVTSVSGLTPLFTTTNPTTTPTFVLSSAAANSVFGNFTGSLAAPAFSASPVFSAANLTNFPTFNQNTTGSAGSLSGSYTANFVLASPNGSAGALTPRALVATDLPALATTVNGTTCAIGGTCSIAAANTLSTQNLPLANTRFEFDFTDLNNVSSTSATDISGSGNTCTFGSGAAAPVLVTPSTYPFLQSGSGLHFSNASAQYCQLPNAYKFGQAGTIYMAGVIDPIGSGQGSIPLSFFGSSNTTETNGTEILSFSNPSSSSSTGTTYTATPYIGSALSPTGGTITSGYFGGFHVWAFVADSSGIAGQVYMDGVQLQTTQAISLNAGGLPQPSGTGNFNIGYVPYPTPQGFTGVMYQVIGTGQQDSKFTIQSMSKKLLQYNQSKGLVTGYGYLPSVNNLVGDQLLAFGDSLTTFVGTVTSTQTWPYVTANTLGIGQTNLAVAGTTLTDWIAAAQYISANVPSQGAKVTVAYELGANDPVTGLHGAAASFARPGNNVKVMQLTNAMGIGGDSNLNTLNIYNRANSTKWADYLCDVAESPILGLNGNETNATYWQQTGGGAGHLTAAGQALKAGIVVNCYKALYGATAINPTSYSTTATATAADNYIDIPPSTAANFTLTLQDGIGLTKLATAPCSINITNRSNFTVTLATQNSESFIGTNTVAPGTNACINIQALSYTTAGVQFVASQVLGTMATQNASSVAVSALKSSTQTTTTVCSSTASPAVCASASAGKVQLAAAATTLTINSTIFTSTTSCTFTYDVSGITPPTNMSALIPPYISARVAGTSLTLTFPVAPATNPVNIQFSGCQN